MLLTDRGYSARVYTVKGAGQNVRIHLHHLSSESVSLTFCIYAGLRQARRPKREMHKGIRRRTLTHGSDVTSRHTLRWYLSCSSSINITLKRVYELHYHAHYIKHVYMSYYPPKSCYVHYTCECREYALKNYGP